MRKQTILMCLGVLLTAVLTCGCGPKYEYQVPPQTGDGWQVASLEDVGMDARQIRQMIDDIEAGDYGPIHSVVLVKDDQLVFEEYFGGYTFNYDDPLFLGDYVDFDADTIHNQASVAKIFTATAVGIAIDKGYLPGVEASVCGYFPDYADLCDEDKQQITIEHLLTMTSGLSWNQGEVSISDTSSDLIQLWIVDDPIAYIFEKPVVATPGTRYYYKAADPNLLGEIIQAATGMMLDEFAAQYLFPPLGITQYEWDYVNEDMVWASGNNRVRPRDMAKMGYLYLNDGVWNGQQVLSPEWVAESTQAYAAVSPGMAQSNGDQYGYQWFLRTYEWGGGTADAFLRTGWGGQVIVCFPELDLIVVMTGGNYAGDYMTPIHEMIETYILPSISEQAG